ncbi:MAG: DNA-binding response regulator [uncultured Sulfurovum sp.]|uniref:DNA-binding response regulator n=1 Tax=uncultured Sulfurovum sp. TaxID=269237 RepID=A0A6S6TQU1_9BACT|nr:MAG: DNA-binding response regulator [uncultured Sulfurovum sp.]
MWASLKEIYRHKPNFEIGVLLALKILLLEDDKLFNETLQDFLEEENFIVDCVLDPYSALDLSYDTNYNLYLFDVNLPYESGFDLLQKLRASGDDTPTIFITSRDDKNSLKEGFTQGADDYITKPVDLDELLLRINAVLRRQVRTQVVQVGEYEFDTLRKTLSLKGVKVELSVKSSELLFVLLEGQGEVVPLEQLKAHLWSASEEASDGALRVYIAQLKKYFPEQIENLRGVGYRIQFR